MSIFPWLSTLCLNNLILSMWFWTTIPILQVRKMKLRDLSYCVQHSTASKSWNEDKNFWAYKTGLPGGSGEKKKSVLFQTEMPVIDPFSETQFRGFCLERDIG